MIHKRLTFLKEYRGKGLKSVLIAASDITEIDPEFERIRGLRKKNMFSYENEDLVPPDPEILFRTNVFILC